MYISFFLLFFLLVNCFCMHFFLLFVGDFGVSSCERCDSCLFVSIGVRVASLKLRVLRVSLLPSVLEDC